MISKESINSIVIRGLPGAGKTTLAIALAYHLQAQNQHPFLLHTDILKVSLASFFPVMQGVTTDHNFGSKLQCIYPYLQAQAEKACRDGYLLIIEGTLASSLLASPKMACLDVVVDTPISRRRERIDRKHLSAQGVVTDLPLYALYLQQSITSATLVLDGTSSIETQVEQVFTKLTGVSPPFPSAPRLDP